MCTRIAVGILLCALTWCNLAGLPGVAQAGLYTTTTAMVICSGRPVIAFSNWGAGAPSALDELLIATAASPQPAAQGAWRLHAVRPGLRLTLADYGLGRELTLFPVGKGLGLVSTAAADQQGNPSQLFAAWCQGLPQASTDWVVSPIGLRVLPEMGQLAATGTAEFIAAAYLPEPASLPAGTPRIPGIYLAVAQLPLAGDYADWRTVCVQLDKFSPPADAAGFTPVLGQAGNLNLAVCQNRLVLAGGVDLQQYNPLGVKRVQHALVVGVCEDPLRDPGAWRFSILEERTVQWYFCQLAADGGQLYLTYNKSIDEVTDDTWLLQCSIDDALKPSAWRASRAVNATDFQLVDGYPAAVHSRWQSILGNASYDYALPGGVQPEWATCPVPLPAIEPCLGLGAQLPVICGYSFEHGLQCVWTADRFPQSLSDWHVSTVLASKPPGAPATAPSASSPPVFAPMPASDPTERMQASAVSIPPPYRLTWQLALIAGLAISLAWWSVFVLRKRPARA